MVRIVTFNVNGWTPTARNIVLKYGSLKAFFEDVLEADVVCIQEAKIQNEKLSAEVASADGWESFWACSAVKKGYSGCTTFCRLEWSPLDAKLDALGASMATDDDAPRGPNESPPEPAVDGEGRCVETDHGAFVLINVYVPNGGDPSGPGGPEGKPRLRHKLAFLRALEARVKSLRSQGRDVVVVGDLNVARFGNGRDAHPDFDLDSIYSNAERRWMERYVSGATAVGVDAFRHLYPAASRTYTVWDEKRSYRAIDKGLRIDYVLISGDALVGALKECRVVGDANVIPWKWSDHAAVVATFDGVAAPHAAGSVPPPHPLSSRAHPRLKQDATQRSLLSMFKPRAAGDAAEPAASGEARNGGGGVGGGSEGQQPGSEDVAAVGAKRPAGASAGGAPARKAKAPKPLLPGQQGLKGFFAKGKS